MAWHLLDTIEIFMVSLPSFIIYQGLNMKPFFLLSSLLVSTNALAEPFAVGTLSIFKMILVLVFIVGLILVLHRFANKQLTKMGSDKLSVIASIPIGQKERAVLIDVMGEKILIGVSPGSVKHLSTIHTNKTFEAPVDEK